MPVFYGRVVGSKLGFISIIAPNECAAWRRFKKERATHGQEVEILQDVPPDQVRTDCGDTVKFPWQEG